MWKVWNKDDKEYDLINALNKFPEQVANTSKVYRTGRVCTTHTIPDMPVNFYQASAAYHKEKFLFVCGGYIPEEGTDVTGEEF